MRVITNRLPVDVGRVPLFLFAIAIEVLACLPGLQAINQALGKRVVR